MARVNDSRLSATLIISQGEVGIDVPVGDHGEVEMVSFCRLVRINGADELNELRHTKTHDSRDEPQVLAATVT